MPDEIDSSALNEWLFNENTVNKVYISEKLTTQFRGKLTT